MIFLRTVYQEYKGGPSDLIFSSFLHPEGNSSEFWADQSRASFYTIKVIDKQ